MFAKFLQINSQLSKFNKGEKELILTQPDEKILFRQLKTNCKAGDFDVSEEQALPSETDFLNEMKQQNDQRIYQLTGYSDPIYAEAIAEVHHYDILLRIVLTNRTSKTIQNIACELVT